jgi:hypothetical protein
MNTSQELLSPKGWLVFEGMGSFCFPLWWLEGALCKGDIDETMRRLYGKKGHPVTLGQQTTVLFLGHFLQLGHFFSLKQYLMFLQVVILWSQGVDHVNLGPGT